MSIFSKDLIQDEEYINKLAAIEKWQKIIIDAFGAYRVDERPKNLESKFVAISPSMDNPEHVFLIGYDCDTPMCDCVIKSSFTKIK